jgi:hypothetical protein
MLAHREEIAQIKAKTAALEQSRERCADSSLSRVPIRLIFCLGVGAVVLAHLIRD